MAYKIKPLVIPAQNPSPNLILLVWLDLPSERAADASKCCHESAQFAIFRGPRFQGRVDDRFEKDRQEVDTVDVKISVECGVGFVEVKVYL